MNRITLVCPRCKRTRKTPLDKSDPKGTARIVTLCPKCNPSGFEDLNYYDAEGKELVP